MPELFELKMRALFNRFDVDNSGTIEQNEFDSWADRLISYGNLDDAKAQELRTNISKAWSKMTQASTEGHVNFDAFLNYALEVIYYA
jgi:Ca2+-binding EF-hand superfamily protein